MDAVVAEIDGMMKAENGRLGDLDIEIAENTLALQTVLAEKDQLEKELEVAKEMTKELEGKLQVRVT